MAVGVLLLEPGAGLFLLEGGGGLLLEPGASRGPMALVPPDDVMPAQPQEHWEGESVVFDVDVAAALNEGETAGDVPFQFDLYPRGVAPATVTLSTAGGGIAATGAATVRVDLAAGGDSKALPPGRYEYAVWRTDAGVECKGAYGPWTVKPSRHP